MIKSQLYRIFIKNHLLFFFVAILLLKLYGTTSDGLYLDYNIEKYHEEYVTYMDAIEGELTEQKEAKIKKDYTDTVLTVNQLQKEIDSLYDNNDDSLNIQSKTSELFNEKIQLRIMSMIYDEFMYVNECPNKRQLMYVNGWEAWIGNEHFDFTIVLFMIVFTMILCGEDYEKGTALYMYGCRNGKSKRIMLEQSMILIAAIMLSLSSAFMEFFYYQVQFGLSGWNYSIQSLPSYSGSEYSMTIYQTVIFIIVLKILGLVLLGTLGSFIINLTKNYSKYFIAMICIAFIPYALLSFHPLRYIILPLGMLLASGFVKGYNEGKIKDFSCITMSFEGVSMKVFIILLLIVAIIILGIFDYRYIRSGHHNKRQYHTLYFINGIALIILVLCLTQVVLLHETNFEGTYSAGTGYQDEDHLYLYDGSDLLMSNKNNSIWESVIRDPFNSKRIVDSFVDDEAIYYLQIDENTGENIYKKITINDFTEKRIYSEIRGIRNYIYDTKYLGLIPYNNINNQSEQDMEAEMVVDFWVDNEILYTVDHLGINKIDLITENKERLIETWHSSVAYDKGIIYYLDENNAICSFDSNTEQRKTISDRGYRTVYYYGEAIYAIDLQRNVCKVTDTTVLLANTKISDSSHISFNGEGIFYIDENLKIVHLKNDFTSSEISIENSNETYYNVIAYENMDMLMVYSFDGKEYMWKEIKMA